jgi:predicted RNA binding protein YcfA (HicA-like mRNA interferase family)
LRCGGQGFVTNRAHRAAGRRTTRNLSRDVKVRDIIKRLERDGWRHVATRGSHRQYRHAEKPGRVTVPGALGKDLTPGTLRSILKQARLDRP